MILPSTTSRLADEPVTLPVLELAVERAVTRDRVKRATAVEYVRIGEQRALALSLDDSSTVMLLARDLPEFAQLSDEELQSVKVGFAGMALCLDARDLHVAIQGLLATATPARHASRRRLKKMNRRQQKKLRLGPFQDSTVSSCVFTEHLSEIRSPWM